MYNSLLTLNKNKIPAPLFILNTKYIEICYKLYVNTKKNIIFSNNFFFSKTLNFYFLFKNNIFYNFQKKNNKTNFFFFNFFLQKYFSQKIKSKCYIQLCTKNFFFFNHNKYFNWIIILIKKLNILNLINLNLIKKFLEIFLIFMYTKDTFFLANWLKITMEGLYYKNHKKFLMFFKNILFFLFKYLKTFFLIRGLNFVLRGKIALGGNSKKKIFKLNIGCCSLTTKKSLVNYNKNFLKTISGTLGYSIFIFF